VGGAVTLVGGLWLAGQTPASATLINAIHALNPGDSYRVAFVTSGTYNASSTTTGTYNHDVQVEAANGSVTASLGLTWNAFVSAASTSAIMNTGVDPVSVDPVYYFNTRGDIVAMSDADLLDGALLQPISFDENGKSRSAEVWTGSNFDGTVATGDSLGSNMAVYGNSYNINSAWADIGIAAVGQPLSLYGLSSLATVKLPTQTAPSNASIPIPEPGSAGLVALGLAGLARRYRCRTRRHA
jgi:hypothetical protein